VRPVAGSTQKSDDPAPRFPNVRGEASVPKTWWWMPSPRSMKPSPTLAGAGSQRLDDLLAQHVPEPASTTHGATDHLAEERVVQRGEWLTPAPASP
jgi:hypothetical protein